MLAVSCSNGRVIERENISAKPVFRAMSRTKKTAVTCSTVRTRFSMVWRIAWASSICDFSMRAVKSIGHQVDVVNAESPQSDDRQNGEGQ